MPLQVEAHYGGLLFWGCLQDYNLKKETLPFYLFLWTTFGCSPHIQTMLIYILQISIYELWELTLYCLECTYSKACILNSGARGKTLPCAISVVVLKTETRQMFSLWWWMAVSLVARRFVVPRLHGCVHTTRRCTIVSAWVWMAVVRVRLGWVFVASVGASSVSG